MNNSRCETMTRTEIMAASDAELDALMAEHIMGQPWRKPTHGTCCTCQTCGHSNEGDYCQCHYSDPEYIEQACMAQDKLPEGKPRRWYARCLTNLLKLAWKDRNDSIGLCVKCLYASPRDRCRAMLLAKLEKWDD